MSDEQKQNEKTFGGGGSNARVILIVCALLYMVNYMDRQVLSVVLEPMKADLGLTDAQAGLIQTVFFLSMAILAFPISFFIDRWSRRKTVALMAIIWSIATYVTGLGRNFLGVLLPRIFVGTGEAGFSAGGTAWITAAYPPESRGKALGIFNIAVPIGGALGVMLGGYLSVHFGGWRTPFFVFAVPGIVLGIIAFFLPDYKTIKQPEEGAVNRRSVFTDTADLWRVPTLVWLFFGYGLRNIMAFSVFVWSPALFMRTLNISESKAGFIVGIMGLLGIIGALLGGWQADVWKKRGLSRMLVPAAGDFVTSVCCIIGFLLLPYGHNNSLVMTLSFIFLALYSVFSMVSPPALGAVTQDVVHPRLKGISWGMAMFAMFMLGGAWGPALVGAMSDRFGGGAAGLQTALTIAAATGILGAILFWISSRHYKADCDKVAHCKIESER